MSAKKFLSQAFYLNLEIRGKREELEVLRSAILNVSSKINDTPTKSSYVTSNDDLLCKVIDYENEINKDIIRLIDIKKDINNTINKLQDSRARTVFHSRYILFKSFDDISKELNYCKRQVLRIHKEVLKSLDSINI